MVFVGVSDVQHAPGSRVSKPDWVKLGKDVARMLISVSRVDLERQRGAYAIRLFMGDAGSLSFSFESLWVARRLGEARPRGPDDWVYRDVESGEDFELTEPFPRAWPSDIRLGRSGAESEC